MTDRSGKQIDFICTGCGDAYATHFTADGQRLCAGCRGDLDD